MPASEHDACDAQVRAALTPLLPTLFCEEPLLPDPQLSSAQRARRHLLHDASPLALQLVPDEAVEATRQEIIASSDYNLSALHFRADLDDFSHPDDCRLLLHAMLIVSTPHDAQVAVVLVSEGGQWKYHDLLGTHGGSRQSLDWRPTVEQALHDGTRRLRASQQADASYWDDADGAAPDTLEGDASRVQQGTTLDSLPPAADVVGEARPPNEAKEVVSDGDSHAGLRRALRGIYELWIQTVSLERADAREAFLRAAEEVSTM